MLTDQRYHDFRQGTLGEAVSSSEAPSGTLDVALSPTRSKSEKYHLLLRGPSLGAIIHGEIVVTFE